MKSRKQIEINNAEIESKMIEIEGQFNELKTLFNKLGHNINQLEGMAYSLRNCYTREEIILIYRRSGMKYQDIADKLGITPQAVYSCLKKNGLTKERV